MSIVTIDPKDKIIGIYKPDENTRNNVRGYNNKINSYLKINNGGILEYNLIPLSTISFTEYFNNNDSTISGVGSWETANKNGFIELNLTFNVIDRYIYTATLPLYKKENKYIIYDLVGDPRKNIEVIFIPQ